jgi:hypothetical protein
MWVSNVHIVMIKYPYLNDNETQILDPLMTATCSAVMHES